MYKPTLTSTSKSSTMTNGPWVLKRHQTTSVFRTVLAVIAMLAGWMNFQTLAQPLLADFAWDVTTTCETDSVKFGDSTQFGAPSYFYFWDFGDAGLGDTAIIANPKWDYSDTGTYTVQLIITDQAGAQDTMDTNIYISLPATAAAGLDASICEGNPYTLAGSIGGSASSATWSTDGDGSFDNPSLLNATYTPSNTDILNGTVFLTLTTNVPAGPCGPVLDVLTLTINPLSLITNSTNASCTGGNDGTASVTIDVGTPPYTYLWDNSASTSSITGLVAGSYNVTVSDGNGCSSTSSATVNEPTEPLTAYIIENNEPFCFGGTDGDIFVQEIGGTGPSYTYLWDDPTSSTWATLSGIPAGNYTATVTDANGCVTTAMHTLGEPTEITATIASTEPSCNGNADGTATVTGNGGTPTYNYTWSNTLDDTTSVTGLVAGTYSVTVTDVYLCTGSTTDTIIEPALLTASITASTDPLCNGGCDGTATGAANGGTGAHNYLWSNSGTTPGITGLCVGSYDVTVTDDNGCTASDSIDLTEPAVLTASITASTNPLCNGGCDGTATGAANGGTGAHNYLWSNSGITPGITGLCVGSYDVTVTDDNGCTASDSIYLTEPAALTASTTGYDATCFGGCDGMAYTIPAGGVGPYSYSWDDPLFHTNDTVMGLCAGTYNVTITDDNGCTVTGSITIIEPSAIVVTLSGSAPLCNGGCDGTAIASATGGNQEYMFMWSNSAFGDTITGLCAGTYTVTVDDGGCMDSGSFNVVNPDSILYYLDGGDPTCFGQADGFVTANITGGTPPYDYQWDDPNFHTTDSVMGLAAGTYSITVTDPNLCPAFGPQSHILSDPINLTTAVSGTAACNAACNGTATANPSGGTPPYSYQWNDPGSQNTATAIGLCPGADSVLVMDSQGCTAINGIVINELTAISTTINITDATCNGLCDGQATVTASGGITPYTYLWDDLAAQTTATATGLCASIDSVTVTDSAGCTVVDGGTIIEPAAIVLSTSSTNSNCGQPDGSVSVSVTGGTGNYTYMWDDPGSSATASVSNIVAGTYNVTVEDGNTCVAMDAAIVNDNGGPTVTTIVDNNVSCNGGSDGQVSTSILGGTGPYTYQWDDPSAQTDSTAISLVAGTFNVVVTDAIGCIGGQAATVTEPTALVAAVNPVDESCQGVCDGAMNLTPSGGTTPYTYIWSNSSVTQNISGLCAGNYQVTITDSLGCIATGDTSVAPGTAVTATINSTNVTCNGGNDGTANVTATGGTPTYNYLWDNSGTTSSISGLVAGSYNVTVTDSNGCTGSDSTTITEPGPLSVALGPDTSVMDSIMLDAGAGFTGYNWSTGDSSQTLLVTTSGTYSVIVADTAGCTATDTIVVTVNLSGPTASATGTDANCNSGCDGTATGAATGGTLPYSYLWDDPGAQATATASNLCAGTYMVIVTDAASMADTAYVTIVEPTAINTTTSSTDALCNGACDGTATTTASGGTGTYSYSWSNTGSTDIITGLCAGTYTVSISDSAGCSITDNVTVGEPSAIVLTTTSTDASCGNTDGTATVSASGGTGAYTYLWDDPAAQTIATANALLAGSYTVVVTDAANCSNSEVAIVNDTGAPSATATSTDVSCNGAADGSATVTATGGTTPYTYTWDDPAAQTVSNAANLAGGTYSVLVTDASGCIAGVAVTITEPALLTVAATGTTVTACSNSDGTASAAVSGGTVPYTYNWSSGGTTQNITGLTAGTYTVDVADANGCTASDAVTIGQIATISVSISGTDVTSCGLSDGAASIVITGGATPISVLWSTGETTNSISGLSAGLYSVEVIDSMGCAGGSTNILITEPPSLTAIVVGTDLSSCGAGDGSAVAASAGGVAPYQYLWSTGDTTFNITGVPAGTHSVTIIDANGCTAGNAVILTEPAAFTTTVTGTDATCNLGTEGYADLTTTGGASPFSYLWSNGDMLEDIGGLAAGTYYVDVTDGNGCAASDSVVINEPTAVAITITAQDASGCGATDGAASVTVTGGTAPYGYVWSNGDTNTTASNLSSGTHYLTLTDASGCIAYGTFNVNAATGPTITVDNVSDVTCAGAANGSIDVTVIGGTSPYTYLWTHGATTEDVSGLQGTVYELTVTDALGCVASATATVSEPTSINVQVFTTEASCNAADGYAEIFATGGTSPYTYQWSTFGTSTSQSGLAAGSYTVNVLDANGCFIFTQISINSLGGPTITLDSINHTSCDYPSGGLIDLSITGGTAPYNYAWSTGDNTEDLNNLIDTNYNVVVTDVNGCSAANNFDIFYLPPQDVEICIITVDSATGKNLIVWEKPTSASSIENYYIYKEHTQAGVYFLLGVVPFDSLSTFVDLQANPQQRSWRYKITAGDTCISGVESDLSPLHKSIHLTINQGLNGKINLIWDKYDGFFVNTYVIYRGTSMGQMDSLDAVPSTVNSYTDVNPPISNSLFYKIAAIHPQGCDANKGKNFNSSKSNTSSINPTDAMSVDVTGQDVSFGNCDGEATVSVTVGGVAPFTYVWDDPLAQTTAIATDLCPGNYMVVVIDALGDTITGNVAIGTLPSVLELNGKDWISAFPNPYTGQTTISYRLVRDAQVSLEVYDVLGKRVAVLADEMQQSGSYNYVFGSEGYQNPNGVYFVKLIANSKLHTKRIIELK